MRRIGAAIASVAGFAGLIWGVAALLPEGSESAHIAEDEAELVQSEATADSGIVLAAAASEAFLDIRGAPMIINLPEGPALGAQRVVLSEQIDPQRARIGAGIVVIEDALLDARQRVQLTLPSSSADLAAFQARRETAIIPTAPTPVGPVSAGARVTLNEDAGSWGDVLSRENADPTSVETVSYVETVIENTTTEVVSLPSRDRQPLFRDTLVRLEEDRQLAEILEEAGLSEPEAARVAAFAARLEVERGAEPDSYTQLPSGGLVALRVAPAQTDAVLQQVSLYTASRYLVTLAQPGPGRFEAAADPWFSENLLNRASRAVRARGQEGRIKLKDAIYSTALRNGLSSEMVGELMVMLSRVQDLDSIASEQDRLKLLITEERGGIAPAGRILFAAVEGPDSGFRCYVVRPRLDGAPFGCFDPNAGGGGVNIGLGAGFLVPVSGTKTSGFGPRNHPILKKITNHNGVDWGAPTGTPVRASAAGRVVRADFSGSFGNVVYIDHPSGIQTRYAHLDSFAEGLTEGMQVQAGDLIGAVGTTGRSTGPHLHFEMWVDGRPVDPLAVTRVAGASGAVDALVQQIIRVESAGDARAKNTRSSATGLGQFINSTWLRMMRTYRPDLAATLSEAELLELRFDPALSRAMVTNLARENESYLRSRGHAITPGRLYLAHFLGPQGADVALRADPEATVIATMGASVVGANPFLQGKTVQWMTDWSDRKMSRVAGGRAVAAAVPQPTPADVERYKAAIAKVLERL